MGEECPLVDIKSAAPAADAAPQAKAIPCPKGKAAFAPAIHVALWRVV